MASPTCGSKRVALTSSIVTGGSIRPVTVHLVRLLSSSCYSHVAYGLCLNSQNMNTAASSLASLHFRVPLALPLDQTPQAQIIHHIFHTLDVVLDGIRPLAQNIILQVQQLEPAKQVLDECADGHRQLEVPEGHGVGGQARKLRGQVGERQEVLLDGDVEGVTVFEVGGDWAVLVGRLNMDEGQWGVADAFEDLADVLEG